MCKARGRLGGRVEDENEEGHVGDGDGDYGIDDEEVMDCPRSKEQ